MSDDTIPYAHRLVDRVAVVTGGASGIGRAMCERFAAEGAQVAVVDLDEEAGRRRGRRGRRHVRAGRRHLRRRGGGAVRVEVAAAFGGIDICCNNAGISPPDDDSILETGLEAWERVQRVNLTSVYLCCKLALPHLLARARARSSTPRRSSPSWAAATSQVSYTASKGGVLAMSRELGVQFARQGVRVNALCPGPVNTPLLQELFAKDPERAARRLVHIPMGRFGEASEIAAAAAFLASDDSSFITASTFLVDGGLGRPTSRRCRAWARWPGRQPPRLARAHRARVRSSATSDRSTATRREIDIAPVGERRGDLGGGRPAPPARRALCGGSNAGYLQEGQRQVLARDAQGGPECSPPAARVTRHRSAESSAQRSHGRGAHSRSDPCRRSPGRLSAPRCAWSRSAPAVLVCTSFSDMADSSRTLNERRDGSGPSALASTRSGSSWSSGSASTEAWASATTVSPVEADCRRFGLCARRYCSGMLVPRPSRRADQ